MTPCASCMQVPEVGGRCENCGTTWEPDEHGTLQQSLRPVAHDRHDVVRDGDVEDWSPPPDFGPVDVLVNGRRYVREETLFAAVERVDALRAALERIYETGRGPHVRIAREALDA